MGVFVTDLRTFPQFLHVRGCMHVCVCVLACINSLQSGWLCSQTPQSGCIATNSPRSPLHPPPLPDSSVRAFELTEGTCKHSPLPSRAHPQTRRRWRAPLVRLQSRSLRASACVVRACYLWIPQSRNMKEGQGGRSPPPQLSRSITDRERDEESSSARFS